MPRYAARQDNNAHEIDKGLEQIPGLTIWKLGNATIDRLVGFRGKNYLLEYKEPKGKPTESQIKFIQEWQGQVNIVRDLRDALMILGVLK